MAQFQPRIRMNVTAHSATETDCMYRTIPTLPIFLTVVPHIFYLIILMLNHNREYELTVRQEPKQARMCGVGGQARFPLRRTSITLTHAPS